MGWGALGLGDDLGWGALGLGDGLGWDGKANRDHDAQGCEGGPPPLGLLERDTKRAQKEKAKEREGDVGKI